MATSASSHAKPATAPVPPSSYSNYHYQQQTAIHNPRPQRSLVSTFLCRFLMAIAAAFALMAIISITVKHVLKQRYPEIQVVSASVTKLKTTSYDLTANWDVMLIAKNPNHKLTLYYDTITAGITYGKFGLLDSKRFKPFVQGTRAQDAVGLGFAAYDKFVGKDVAKEIGLNMAVGGVVPFGLRLSGWVRFKNGIIKSRYHFWESVCDPLLFHFSAKNGTATLMNPVTCK